jgi:hypothetical protein
MFPEPFYFLPGLKDNAEGRARLASLPKYQGGRPHKERESCESYQNQFIFYLGSKTTEGRARLASLPEYQGRRPPKERKSCVSFPDRFIFYLGSKTTEGRARLAIL